MIRRLPAEKGTEPFCRMESPLQPILLTLLKLVPFPGPHPVALSERYCPYSALDVSYIAKMFSTGTSGSTVVEVIRTNIARPRQVSML